MATDEAAALPPPTQGNEPSDFAAAVRLPDYYPDRPQAWFRQINSTFAASRVTRPLTKFHWAVSKLPAALIDTIGALCDNPAAVADPYEELQSILTLSYGLSAAQRTALWLDHPGPAGNRPSVFMDQLSALKPPSVDEAQKVIFYRKMPTYIQDAVNLKDYPTMAALTTRCNELWDHRSLSGGNVAAAAAQTRPPSPARDRRSQSPHRGGKAGKQGGRPPRRRSPTPAAPRSYPDSAGRCFYHSRYGADARKCREPCTYQDN